MPRRSNEDIFKDRTQEVRLRQERRQVEANRRVREHNRRYSQSPKGISDYIKDFLDDLFGKEPRAPFGGGGADASWEPPAHIGPKKRRTVKVPVETVPYYHTPCGNFTVNHGWGGEPYMHFEEAGFVLRCKTQPTCSSGNFKFPKYVSYNSQNNIGCKPEGSCTSPQYLRWYDAISHPVQTVLVVEGRGPGSLNVYQIFIRENWQRDYALRNDPLPKFYGDPCTPPVSYLPAQEWEPDPNQERKEAATAPDPEPPEEEEPERDDPPESREWFFPPIFIPAGMAPVPMPQRGLSHRRPPRKNRERETRKSKGAIFKMLKTLDRISEASEVVDSIFSALPCPIQKAVMEKCRAKGMIDGAGQFGIDQADCKLPAIWKHWNKIDTDVALANIIRNQIEDEAYGQVHKRLPRNLSSAAGLAEKFGNKPLKQDGDFGNDKAIESPLNDLISALVDHTSDAFGLPEPLNCKGV